MLCSSSKPIVEQELLQEPQDLKFILDNPFTEYGNLSSSEEMVDSFHEQTSSPEHSTNQSIESPSQMVTQANESSRSSEEEKEVSVESSS